MWLHTDVVVAFYWAVVFCFPGKHFPSDAAVSASAKTLPHRVAETATVRNNEDCFPCTFGLFCVPVH